MSPHSGSTSIVGLINTSGNITIVGKTETSISSTLNHSALNEPRSISGRLKG